ncbi:MAG: hypothetical protein WDO16_16615 [Bacteroidota bacterium]
MSALLITFIQFRLSLKIITPGNIMNERKIVRQEMKALSLQQARRMVGLK